MRNDKYNLVRKKDNVVILRNKSRYQIIIYLCIPKGKFKKFIGKEVEYQGEIYVIQTKATPENILFGNKKTSDDEKYENACKMLETHGNTCVGKQRRGKEKDYYYIVEVVS